MRYPAGRAGRRNRFGTGGSCDIPPLLPPRTAPTSHPLLPPPFLAQPLPHWSDHNVPPLGSRGCTQRPDSGAVAVGGGGAVPGAGPD